MAPTVYQDNAVIPDREKLFRRIALVQLVPDENNPGLTRISSGAFKDKEMSVDLESKLVENGIPPQGALANYPTHRLVSIGAGDARTLNQSICYDPMPDDLAHGLVYGPKNGKTSERLRELASWVIPPQPPQYAVVAAEKKAAGLLVEPVQDL